MKKHLGIGLLAAITMSSLATTTGRTGGKTAQLSESLQTLQEKSEKNSGSSENRNVSAEQIQKLAASNEFRGRQRPFVYQSNPGTPPKIYGMNFVKRGTHKRTNV